MRGLMVTCLRHMIQSSRSLHCTFPLLKVDKSLLSKLRKQTGIPFISCKKALEKYDNDFDSAKKWLLEEAKKEGWARATKLMSRPMSQGLVAVVGDKTQVTMLEVNCETDFVAKNEKFIALVTQLAQECKTHFESQSNKQVLLNKDELGKIVSKTDENTLADLVALNVGNLGENMALRRGAYLRADSGSVISYYVHPSGQNPKSIQFGKYGALVELFQHDSNGKPVEPLSKLGSNLCQHIVGMNPKTVGTYSPSSEVAKEKADSLNEESMKGEGEEVAQRKDEEDEDEMLKQEFLLDTTISVGELVCMNNVEVKGFVRYALGEDLEAEKTS